MSISNLITACGALSAVFQKGSRDLALFGDMTRLASTGILGAKEIAEQATDIMKGTAQNALVAGQALQIQASDLTALVDKVIKGNKELEDLAGSSVGGYLDRIAEIVQALKDPKNKFDPQAQQQGNAALQKIETFMRRFDPFFNIDSFTKMIENGLTKAIPRVAAATRTAGGSGSGGFTLSLTPAKTPPNPNTQSLQTLINTGQIKG